MESKIPEDQGQSQAVIEEPEASDGRPLFRYAFTSGGRPPGDPLSRTVEVLAHDIGHAQKLALDEHKFDVRKENAHCEYEEGCPELVEAKRVKEAQMRPLIDSLRSQLAAAGADVSNLGDDVLEALITVGRQALTSMGGRGIGPDIMAFPGSAFPGGFGAPPPVVPIPPVSGRRNGIPVGADAFAPRETFSLGGYPGALGMAEQSAFGFLVAQYQDRQRKVKLFRDVLAGGALYLGALLAPEPHPFEFAARGLGLGGMELGPGLPFTKPPLESIPAPGEGF